METKDNSDRRSIIDAIKTPLGFFSLVVLVTETLLGGLTLASTGADRTFLIYAIVGILVLLILLVTVVAIFFPEALWGERYSALEESLAVGLSEEIYFALDGYLLDLGDVTREEAYDFLQMTITSSRYARSKSSRKFCGIFVEHIMRRAKLKGGSVKTKGVIRP